MSRTIHAPNPLAPRLASLLAATAFLCLPLASRAQYQVYSWENLETGEFPPSLSRMHAATPNSLKVVDFASAPGLPEGIYDAEARRECGRYGLKFASGGKEAILGVACDFPLDRQRLGESGRALFQADFWIPPEGAKTPNIGVCAIATGNDENGKPFTQWVNYRLGLSGGNGKNVFFTLVTNPDKPDIKLEEPVENLVDKRPGWHRFQLIFQGQDKIYCAIDGKPTSFSPITDSRLRNLRPGIMSATMPDSPGVCYADNLSIQWSPEEVPLPDSPWVAGSGGAPIFAPGGEAATAMTMAGPSAAPIHPGAPPGMNAPAAAPGVGVQAGTSGGTGWGAQPGAGSAQAGAFAGGAAPAGGAWSGNTGANAVFTNPNAPAAPIYGSASPAAPAAPHVWLDDPTQAWQRCQAEQRPVLVMLYAPRAAAFQRIQKMFQTEPTAADTLRPFVLLRVEVNQLSGGTLAQKLGVFRVPTFLVFDARSQEKLRLTVTTDLTWAAIAQALTAAIR